MLFRIALVLVTAWNLFAALRLDLCDDEGHYFTWSLFPQTCDLDQPPLTAWAVALSRSLLGETVLSVRLWPLLGGVALALAGAAGDADAVRRAFVKSGADFICVDGYQLFGRFAFYAPELSTPLPKYDDVRSERRAARCEASRRTWPSDLGGATAKQMAARRPTPKGVRRLRAISALRLLGGEPTPACVGAP